MTGFQIYLILLLDNIGMLLVPLMAISSATILIIAITYMIKLDDSYTYEEEAYTLPKRIKQIGVTAIIIFALSGLGLTLTPTTGDMVKILVIPKIINNKSLKNIPKNMINVANKWLEFKQLDLQKKITRSN